jgi:hypothetical protein
MNICIRTIEDVYVIEDCVCSREEILEMVDDFIREFVESGLDSYQPPAIQRGTFVGDANWSGVFIDTNGNVTYFENGFRTE